MMEKELGECFIEYCAIMLCTQTLCMCVRELSNMLLTEKKNAKQNYLWCDDNKNQINGFIP